MEFSFAWYWKREEFSDFTLVIKPEAPLAPHSVLAPPEAYKPRPQQPNTPSPDQGVQVHCEEEPPGPRTRRNSLRSRQEPHQPAVPQQPEQPSLSPGLQNGASGVRQGTRRRRESAVQEEAVPTATSAPTTRSRAKGGAAGPNQPSSPGPFTRGGTIQAKASLALNPSPRSRNRASNNPVEASTSAMHLDSQQGSSEDSDLAVLRPSVVEPVTLPVHAVVLTATSDYFRTLIESWTRQDKVLSITVDADDMQAALLMLEYMYTGQLPSDCEPTQLLRMVKLADQFRVNRFLAACNSALDKVPISALTLEDVTQILGLPEFLLESSSMAVARKRAEEKLTDMFGDLEAAWFEEGQRSAFVRLPFRAVRFLVARSETAVYSENTMLVAVSDWLAGQQRGRLQGAVVAQAQAGFPFGSSPGQLGAGGAVGPIPGTGPATLGGAAAPAGMAAAGSAAGGVSAGSSTLHAAAGAGGAGCTNAAGTGGSTAAGSRTSQHAANPAAGGAGSGAGLQGQDPGAGSGAIMFVDLLTASGRVEAAGAGTSGSLETLPPISTADLGVGSMQNCNAVQSIEQELEAMADDLFSLLRVPYLSASFLAILGSIGWIQKRLSQQLLLKAFQLHKADGRVHDVLMAQMGPVAVPRAAPERTALEMEWTVRKADIMALVEECRAEASPAVESTRMFSEPGYYHGGYYWKMVFFVQKKREPKKRRYGDALDVSTSGTTPEEETVYHDFLGITCKAALGSETHTPLVGMTVELTAARFNALGERIAPQRAEVSGYVEDEIPYGVYDFFRSDNLADPTAMIPFTCTREHVHLACKITRCH